VSQHPKSCVEAPWGWGTGASIIHSIEEIMPELRKDPIVGRWVIISSARARRPGNFVDTSDREIEEEPSECVYCHPPQGAIATSVPSEKVAVVPFFDPPAAEPLEFHRTKHGLYEVINGPGAHEVVIETPEHLANMADLDVHQIQLIFEVYADRVKVREADQPLQYILVYKNYGPTAGSRKIGHTRSHIVATPVRPQRVKEKLIGVKRYYEQHQRCVYCDLVLEELKIKERMICETEHFIAFIPFAARFLFEVCIYPKSHHCDFHVGLKGKGQDLAVMMKTVLQKIQMGLDDPAYNFVIQTAPFRGRSNDFHKWETIEQDYHWHIELTPRLTRIAGFEKGTGFYICAVPPENMAEFLRTVEIKK
jgi:UDPglucose--hexose-1-phosphate uridylyltransferase